VPCILGGRARLESRNTLTHPTPSTTHRPPAPALTTASAADPRNRTRLATRLVTLPRRVDVYFEGQPLRRILWTAIAFAVGFYAANTVSLSFGALSVNDVVAAALTVAFYEGVTAVYHRAPRKTLRLLFLNSFKLGVVVALIADAFKLAG
jgi:tetrahydromethanopterin S-methyltransferase subunit E